MPTFRGIMFHTWTRLKDFILRAGQVILIVVIILSFLNSVGSDGSFGNNDSENSLLSAVSKKVGIVFYPMGLTKENWPASVGLFTGIFAKEAVVGTLDTLYSQLNARDVDTEDTKENFSFWGGIKDSFTAIPAGFKGFGSGLKDPLGVNIGNDLSDTEGVAEEMEIKGSTVSVMARYFDGKVGAFAYLLFILIYAPCVAAVAAIYRETNIRWAAFAVFYLTTLAWIISTAFYQLGTFIKHPGSSAIWLLATVAIFGTLVAGLKIRGRSLRVEA